MSNLLQKIHRIKAAKFLNEASFWDARISGYLLYFLSLIVFVLFHDVSAIRRDAE
jgi:hypothetical protein